MTKRPDEEVLVQMVAIECAQAKVLDLISRAEAIALKVAKDQPAPSTDSRADALDESWKARYALRDVKVLVRTAHEEVQKARLIASRAAVAWDAAEKEPPKPEPEKFEIDLGEGVQLVVEVVRNSTQQPDITQGERE